jgi:hypothetical protein
MIVRDHRFSSPIEFSALLSHFATTEERSALRCCSVLPTMPERLTPDLKLPASRRNGSRSLAPNLSSITFEVIAAMCKTADIEMAGVERLMRGER